MEYVAIVIIIALGQYFLYAFSVAGMRQKLGKPPPQMEGLNDVALERAIRVHANTGEQLLLFLPIITLSGYFFDGRLAAGIGILFVVTRSIYRRGYMRDVKGRIPGFIMGDLVLGVLVLSALFGIGRNLLAAA